MEFAAKKRAIVQATIAMFPEMFGLRAFPGETFRISESASYFSGPTMGPETGALLLYTQRKTESGWLDFAKRTPTELRRQVMPL